jgi:hypothetical protein
MKTCSDIALFLAALFVAGPLAADEPPLKNRLMYTFSGSAGGMGNEMDDAVKVFIAHENRSEADAPARHEGVSRQKDLSARLRTGQEALT